MDDDKIREAAEQCWTNCQSVFADTRALEASLPRLETTLRKLVADTAQECAEIADEQGRELRMQPGEAIRRKFNLAD